MITCHHLTSFRAVYREIINQQKPLGFVPTMGALHEGHLSLVDYGKRAGQLMVMSIFVNPTQFGPREDFTQYPRPLEQDIALAQQRGVDVLLLPTTSDIYPQGDSIVVQENQLSQQLCGAFRPGHFNGVCTVVLKLLNIVKPQVMYLGQKDGQQLRILQHMVSNLHLDVEVVGCPTVRESSGLALSSRNQYLSLEQRQAATCVYQALQAVHQSFHQGQRATDLLLQLAHQVLQQQPMWSTQYVDLVQWSDLTKPQWVQQRCMLAIAGFIGATRLIDNIMLQP